MCTCIEFKTRDFYFGRNLDMEYRFGEKVIVTPRNYEFALKREKTFKTKYAMIGMAAVSDEYPLYAEASNEKGLSIAGLYFPGNAYYAKEKAGKINIAPFELIPWLLGNFASIKEAKSAIENINLIDTAFAESLPITHLHWMISDGDDCIVLEQTEEGLQVYDNPMGVMTNNPPFSYHMINVNNYINLTPNNADNRFSQQIDLKPYGRGMGSIGLPGDTSPSSRLVRALFNKLNSVCDEDEESSVSQFFHILDSVSMIKGTTLTEDGKCDFTTYSCCMNAAKGIYYYKTYNNNQISAVRMNYKNMNDAKLSVYELVERQQIRYEN